jgi:hypothetical protein
VLVTGGSNVTTCGQTGTSELFAVNAFTAGASLVASRSDHAAAVLKDGTRADHRWHRGGRRRLRPAEFSGDLERGAIALIAPPGQ